MGSPNSATPLLDRYIQPDLVDLMREGSGWKGKGEGNGKDHHSLKERSSADNAEEEGRWEITPQGREWLESSDRRNEEGNKGKDESKEATETVSSQVGRGRLLNTGRALLESVVCHRDSTETAEGKGKETERNGVTDTNWGLR